MIYNLVVLNNHATIRPAAEGLSDREFECGCRIRSQSGSKSSLEAMVEDLIDNEEFQNLLGVIEDTDGYSRTRRTRETRFDKSTYTKQQVY